MAGKTITKESVLLGADTSQYASAMAKAGKISKKFGAGVANMGKQVAKVGIAAGAVLLAAGAAAAVGIFKSQSAAIDEHAKLAHSIGLTSEAFAAQKMAAELSGVAVADVVKGQQALQKAIGEATLGIGSGAKKLEQLGLSADTLAKLDAKDQFKAVIDRINSLGSHAEKTAAANKLLGGSGVKMMNLIAGGSAGIEDAASQLEKNGGALTDIEAGQVEAANDALTKVQTALGIVAQKFTVEIAPIVQVVAEKFLEMGFSGGAAAGLITDGIGWVVKAIGVAADVWGFFKSAFLGAQAAVLLGLGKIGELWMATTGRMIDALQTVLEFTGIGRNAVLDTLVEFNKAFTDELLSAGADKLEDATDAFESAMNGDASKAIAETFKSIKDGAEEAAAAIAKTADEQKGLNEAIAELANQQVIDDKVGKVAEDIAKKIEQFGLSKDQIKLLDLVNAGASKEQIAEIQAMMAELEGLGADGKIDVSVAKSSPVASAALEAGTVASILQLQKNANTNRDAAEANRQRKQQIRLAEDQKDIQKNGFRGMIDAILGGGDGEFSLGLA